MNKNSFSIISIAFVSGIIIGTLALGLLSFTWAGNVPDPLGTISKISVQDAQTFSRRYITSAVPVNGVIKGFALNKEQLEACDRLLNENPSLTSFRIYMGQDNSSATVGIVVGIDAGGKDNLSSIYRTSGSSSGPCPTVCDQTSNITGN
jgi:hypothetical protein